MLSIGAAAFLQNSNTFQNAEVAGLSLFAPCIPKGSVLALVLFSGLCSLGTGVTQVTLNIRRGSGLTGTVISTNPITAVTPSTRFPFTITTADSVLEQADGQWVITAQCVGATSNCQLQTTQAAAIFLQ